MKKKSILCAGLIAVTGVFAVVTGYANEDPRDLSKVEIPTELLNQKLHRSLEEFRLDESKLHGEIAYKNRAQIERLRERTHITMAEDLKDLAGVEGFIAFAKASIVARVMDQAANRGKSFGEVKAEVLAEDSKASKKVKDAFNSVDEDFLNFINKDYIKEVYQRMSPELREKIETLNQTR